MNASFTILAMMASWGALPPERIPPAEVSPAAFERLDCRQLLRAANSVEADLDVAWDRHERMQRFHRFPMPPAPPPMVRRAENEIARYKGELEAIWQVSEDKGCEARGEDVAWSPGDREGPMSEDGYDDRGAGRYGRLPEEPPAAAVPSPAPAGPAAWPDAPSPEAGPADEAETFGPEAAAAYDTQDAAEADLPPESVADVAEAAPAEPAEADLAGGPAPEEPAEVDGYGDPEPQAAPAREARRDAGPARWPSAGERAPQQLAESGDLDNVDWPQAQPAAEEEDEALEAYPVTPVDSDPLPAARRR